MSGEFPSIRLNLHRAVKLEDAACGRVQNDILCYNPNHWDCKKNSWLATRVIDPLVFCKYVGVQGIIGVQQKMAGNKNTERKNFLISEESEEIKITETFILLEKFCASNRNYEGNESWPSWCEYTKLPTQ